MIYIRFGPPDEQEEHPADPSTYGYEKWRYRYLEGVGTEVVIGFVDEAGDGMFRMSWDDKVRAEIQRTQGARPLVEIDAVRMLGNYGRRLRQ